MMERQKERRGDVNSRRREKSSSRVDRWAARNSDDFATDPFRHSKAQEAHAARAEGRAEGHRGRDAVDYKEWVDYDEWSDDQLHCQAETLNIPGHAQMTRRQLMNELIKH